MENYEKSLENMRNEMLLMWLLSDMEDDYLKKKFDELNEECGNYGFRYYDVNKKGWVNESGNLVWC